MSPSRSRSWISMEPVRCVEPAEGRLALGVHVIVHFGHGSARLTITGHVLQPGINAVPSRAETDVT